MHDVAQTKRHTNSRECLTTLDKRVQTIKISHKFIVRHASCRTDHLAIDVEWSESVLKNWLKQTAAKDIKPLEIVAEKKIPPLNVKLHSICWRKDIQVTPKTSQNGHI